MSSVYKNINGKNLRKKVRAVLSNERGEYLLIQPHSYEKDNWTLVGGGVEMGESYEQAIRREISEETGIDHFTSIQMSDLEHSFCFSQKIIDERKLDYDGQVAKIFWVIVPNDCKVTLQAEEVRASCWAKASEVLKLVKNPKQNELLSKILLEFDSFKEAA